MNSDKGKYEHADALPKPVYAFLIGITLLTALAALLMALLFRVYEKQAQRADAPSFFSLVREPARPEPVLEVHPSRAYVEHRAAEQAVLDSYGWVDAQKGIVRIPVERARNLVLERGLPARSGEAAS